MNSWERTGQLAGVVTATTCLVVAILLLRVAAGGGAGAGGRAVDIQQSLAFWSVVGIVAAFFRRPLAMALAGLMLLFPVGLYLLGAENESILFGLGAVAYCGAAIAVAIGRRTRAGGERRRG